MFKLEITKMTGEAFEHPADEIHWIFSNLADRMYHVDPGTGGPILDSNGNIVGSWEWTPARH